MADIISTDNQTVNNAHTANIENLNDTGGDIYQNQTHVPSAIPSKQALKVLLAFQIFAIVYNVEHGIIPAALPQIRHFYHTNGLLEALIQCVSVFGTQLGVFLVTTYKLPLTKPLLLASIVLVGVACIFTRLTAVEYVALDQGSSLEIIADGKILEVSGSSFKKRIPIWIFMWRFGAGLFSSYPVNLVPRWINLAFCYDSQQRHAHLQIFGIIGTMIGYALTLCSPYQSGIISTDLVQDREFLVKSQHFLNRSGRFGAWINSALASVYHNLSTPQDFRRAFLWTAYFAFIAAIAGLVLIDSNALIFDTAKSEGIQNSIPEAQTDAINPQENRVQASNTRDSTDLSDAESDLHSIALYYSHGFHTKSPRDSVGHQTRPKRNRWMRDYQGVQHNNCLLWMPFANEVQGFIDDIRLRNRPDDRDSILEQSIWKDLKELYAIPEYVGLVGCVWVDTTAAQAVNFWLFTAYTLGMGVSPTRAIIGVGIVFVLGTVIGLWISTRIQSWLKGEIRVIRGISVPKEVLLTMTCLSGAATLFGVMTFLVSGYWKTTLAFTLAVITGAAVIPIAQAAVGQCAPPHLHETAYGSYQFIFQSTWFFGPLVPVFIAWCCSSTVETVGLKFVILLPIMGLLSIYVAYRNRSLALAKGNGNTNEDRRDGNYTEMVALLPQENYNNRVTEE